MAHEAQVSFVFALVSLHEMMRDREWTMVHVWISNVGRSVVQDTNCKHSH